VTCWEYRVKSFLTSYTQSTLHRTSWSDRWSDRSLLQLSANASLAALIIWEIG
jgi:hypothetical protein